MLISIATSLVIAAISGLTFLAYKHPNAYNRIYLPIIAVGAVAQSAVFAWNAGISTISAKLIELMPESQRIAAKAIVEDLSLPTMGIVATSWGVALFLVFLLFLPRLLADDKRTG